MKFMQLAARVARKEGKRSQTAIGDIAETLGLVSEEIAADEEVVKMLVANGRRRLRRKAK